MNLSVAILAGGKATRLYPVTRAIPKSLVEVAGRPFLCHQLERLRESGVRRVVICAGFLGEQIREAVGDGRRFGLEIDHVSDGPALLGTGGALRRSLPVLGPAFLVLYGDSYLEIDYDHAERAFLGSGRPGMMTVFENGGRWDRSNVRFAAGEILAYEKSNPAPDMRHIDYGLGAFEARAFAGFPDGLAFDLVEVYQRLIAARLLAGLEVSQRFYEIGSPEGLRETRAYLTQRKGREHGNEPRNAGEDHATEDHATEDEPRRDETSRLRAEVSD